MSVLFRLVLLAILSACILAKPHMADKGKHKVHQNAPAQAQALAKATDTATATATGTSATTIAPFEAAGLVCPPTLLPQVFGSHIDQYSSATSFCSAYIASTTTQTLMVFTDGPLGRQPKRHRHTTPPAIPSAVTKFPSHVVREACSCLITKAAVKTATEYVRMSDSLDYAAARAVVDSRRMKQAGFHFD